MGILFRDFFNWLVQWFCALFDWLQSAGAQSYNALIGGLAHLFPMVNWAPVQDVLASINYFFPLGECVVMTEGLMCLWAAVWAYRLLKSWLPLVNGV